MRALFFVPSLCLRGFDHDAGGYPELYPIFLVSGSRTMAAERLCLCDSLLWRLSPAVLSSRSSYFSCLKVYWAYSGLGFSNVV